MTKVCIGFCSRAATMDIVFEAKLPWISHSRRNHRNFFGLKPREICTNLIETIFFGGSIWLGRKCGKVKSFIQLLYDFMSINMVDCSSLVHEKLLKENYFIVLWI